MNLHKDKNLFQEILQSTSDLLGLPPTRIEKDYWQTYTLFLLNQEPISEDVVLKGGVALSKCFKLIERIPHDIDLVISRNEGETDSRLKSKLRQISNIITKELPEINIEGLTRKRGMNRKTAHSYYHTTIESYCAEKNLVTIDYSWLGCDRPRSKLLVNSYIGEALRQTNQHALIEKCSLLPFEVKVLDHYRTFCEKIMSLVRFSYSETPIHDLKKKVKHMYDLHQLLHYKEFQDFLRSDRFFEMMLSVANRDAKSLRNNNQWLRYHPIESLFFSDLEENWLLHFEQIYNDDFSMLVYGKLPMSGQVLETLLLIKERMSEMEWEIEIR
ncbi:nucleotidyl transferase AbiEii/AbiGii toxin family protein [Sphingobacterium detergens]|uniref:Nucleotidyltransferase AbiEii toxin of type IV toxin-antitoxin system n=1 Tax=Sphingobacterium detergens TaxID=1145106 RepID=A0A420B7W6_SPHD1|nr:nucleotidyl transferase AbiEii/AbiGii toxin family protein [Sphingobacterium detergens]RKE52773.1 nucleotidyltransferase AbiEii toxin of type IV toxin-antitoxin system [Sphingobacterium detergens]